MDIHLDIRAATLADAGTLLHWRNDPLVRAASHSSDPITPESHLAWLRASLENPKRHLFIVEEAGIAVGTVRVDDEEHASELSWTVAPEARGRGVARHMIVKVAASMPGAIRAEIKQGNTASIKAAEAAGMRLVRQEDGILHFRRPALR